MNLTELNPKIDMIVAAFNSDLDGGECYGDPIVIGYYDGQGEVFIQQGDLLVNVMAKDIDAFCKQLKRAAKFAKESEAA